jgi:hypothetical protein
MKIDWYKGDLFDCGRIVKKKVPNFYHAHGHYYRIIQVIRLALFIRIQSSYLLHESNHFALLVFITSVNKT